MTSQYTLGATKRENFGKRASKRYRKEQLVPAVVYGASEENKSILINSFELTNQIKDPGFYSNVIDLKLGSKKIEVISLAPMISEAMKRIANSTSVSSLFN